MTPRAKIGNVGANRVAHTDALLDRIYLIAEDLSEMRQRGNAAQRARRAGRRICNIIDQVDETLGLDGEET